MDADQALARIRALGFSDADAATLFRHFDDAQSRGKLGHGYSRIEWLETQQDVAVDPSARPALVAEHPGFELWEGNGALGYLTLAAICDRLIDRPPEPSRVVVARGAFPTGM